MAQRVVGAAAATTAVNNQHRNGATCLLNRSLSSFFFASALAFFFAIAFCSVDTVSAADFSTDRLSRYQGNSLLLDIKTDTEYSSLTRAARNHAALVIFIASPGTGHDCKPCPYVVKAGMLFADAWKKAGFSDHPFHVAVVDTRNGYDVFRKAEINQIPVMHLYLPTQGPNAASSQGAIPVPLEQVIDGGGRILTEWVAKKVGRKVPYVEPIDYGALFQHASKGTLVGGLLLVMVLLRRVLSQMRMLWGLVSAGMMLLLNSGLMWIWIRSPPYQSRDQRGNPEIYTSGLQQQNGAEVGATAMMLGVSSIALLLLTYGAPMLKPGFSRDVAVAVCMTLAIVVFSALVACFDKKTGGYPFRMFL